MRKRKFTPVIIDDYREYLRLKKVLGARRVVYKGNVFVCPFCGYIVCNIDRSLPARPYSHLKWNCQKAPWYWILRKSLYKNISMRGKASPQLLKSFEWCKVNRYARQHLFKNLFHMLRFAQRHPELCKERFKLQ